MKCIVEYLSGVSGPDYEKYDVGSWTEPDFVGDGIIRLGENVYVSQNHVRAFHYVAQTGDETERLTGATA